MWTKEKIGEIYRNELKFRGIFEGFNPVFVIHPRPGETDGTEIQHVKIIRLCGRSPSESSSYVLNKAARRCVTSCGIKDSCGIAAQCIHCPFVRRFAFYAIQATIQKPEGEKPSKPIVSRLCELNLLRNEIFFFNYFFLRRCSWRDENGLYFDECKRDIF